MAHCENQKEKLWGSGQHPRFLSQTWVSLRYWQCAMWTSTVYRVLYFLFPWKLRSHSPRSRRVRLGQSDRLSVLTHNSKTKSSNWLYLFMQLLDRSIIPIARSSSKTNLESRIYPAEGYGIKYEGSFLEKSQSGCVQNFCHFVCLHHFWA